MSRWGSVFRIAATAVYAYFSGNWAQLAAQVESERQRRRRDHANNRARAAYNLAQQDRLEVSEASQDAPRTLCLGRVRAVEGDRRPPWTSGTYDEVRTSFVSIAGHEIDAIEQWYIDDIPVTLDGSGYVEPTSVGTAEGYTTTTAGFAVGVTSIPLITGTGTIVAGDVLQIAGDPTYYTCSTGISAPGTMVIAAPGLLKAIPASATAVTLIRAPWYKSVNEPRNDEDTLDGTGAATVTLSYTPVAGSVTAKWVTNAGSDAYATGDLTVDSVVGTTVEVSGGPAGAACNVIYSSVLATTYVRIRPYLGTEAQSVGTDHAAEYPGKLRTTDDFAGIAGFLVDLTFSQDVFPMGPPNIVPVFRAALCYDPRLDDSVTGSSTATWNSADKDADVALSNGDRTASVTNPAQGAVRGTVARDVSGHWYFEFTPASGGSYSADGSQMIGIGKSTAALTQYPGQDADGRGYWGASGQKYAGSGGVAYGANWGGATEIIGVEVNAGAVIFWKNVSGTMTSQGTAFTGLTGNWFPMWGTDTASAGVRGGTINTGQAAFENLPSGASAWGGAGDHDIADSTTWEWTENPALHALRYAMWSSGLGLSTAQISDTTIADVIAAANQCDVSTDFDLVSPTSTVTMVRHRCGAVIPADADHRQAMDSIVDTMAGEWAFDGPDLRIRAGMVRSTSAAIDETWLVEEVSAGDSDTEPCVTATQSISREQRVNRITGRCVDQNQRYQMLPFPAVSDATLISSKGERREEIDYPNVNHPAHAQHLASIEIRRRQAGQVVQMMCDDRALFLQLFDVVTFDLPDWGVDEKLYEVIGVDFPMMGAPQLMLREIADAIFTVDATLSGVDPAPDSSLRAPWSMDTLGTLTVSSGTAALLDNSIVGRAMVTWAAVTDERIRTGGSIEVQFARADEALPAGEWESRFEPGNSTTMTITGLMTGRPYLFRGRVVQRMPLVRGPWSAITAHTMATVIANSTAIGGGNLLRNSSFEVDSALDGLADHWTTYSAGTSGSVTFVWGTGGVSGGHYQQISASGLGTTAGDQAGIYQAIELAGYASKPFVYSAFIRGVGGGSGGVDVRMYIDFYDGASGTGSVVDSTSLLMVDAAAAFARYYLPGTVPSDALSARVYVWMESRGGGTGSAYFDLDACQFEIGAAATAYATRADELLTGVVTTTIIAANAATEVSSSEPANGTETRTRGSGTFVYTRQTIAEASWANSTGSTQTVELFAHASAKYTVISGAGNARLSADYSTSGSLDGSTVADGDVYASFIPLSTTDYADKNFTRRVDVTNGQTIYCAVYCSIVPSSTGDQIDVAFYNAAARITVIKR